MTGAVVTDLIGCTMGAGLGANGFVVFKLGNVAGGGTVGDGVTIGTGTWIGGMVAKFSFDG